MEKLKFGTIDEEFSLTGEDIKLLNTKKSWLDCGSADLDSFKPLPNHVLDEAGKFPSDQDHQDYFDKMEGITDTPFLSAKLRRKSNFGLFMATIAKSIK